MIRDLTVLADGEPVASFSRARLTGRDALGLLPMPFTLRLWNLSDPDHARIVSAGSLSVLCGGSVLASGTRTEACRRAVPGGLLTEAVFSAGIRLWEAPVSLSVEAGVSVSETLRRILAASGTGVSLLAFPSDDPVRARGQAFFGRAAECAEEALSAAGAVGCLTPAGLCAVPVFGLAVSMELSEEDLLDSPEEAGENLLLLRTRPVGWPLGKTVRVSAEGKQWTGLVTERSMDADDTEGCWQSELLIAVTPGRSPGGRPEVMP